MFLQRALILHGANMTISVMELINLMYFIHNLKNLYTSVYMCVRVCVILAVNLLVSKGSSSSSAWGVIKYWIGPLKKYIFVKIKL